MFEDFRFSLCVFSTLAWTEGPIRKCINPYSVCIYVYCCPKFLNHSFYIFPIYFGVDWSIERSEFLTITFFFLSSHHIHKQYLGIQIKYLLRRPTWNEISWGAPPYGPLKKHFHLMIAILLEFYLHKFLLLSSS